MKLTHTKSQTLSHSVACMHKHPPPHTHTWTAPTLITSADRNPSPSAPPPPHYIYINHNNNSQPGAEASFSVNKSNEPDILVSLWPSKMIQSGQISVHTKSVSAHSSPMSALEELLNFVVNSNWLLLCNSKINERGLLADTL